MAYLPRPHQLWVNIDKGSVWPGVGGAGAVSQAPPSGSLSSGSQVSLEFFPDRCRMSPLAKIRSCSGVRPSERRQGVGTCALALQSGVGLTRVLDPTAWKNALEESNRGPAWVPHVWLQAAEEPGDGQQGVHGPRATTPRAPWEFRARGGGARRCARGTTTLTGPLETEDGPRFPQRGRCHCLAYPSGPAQPLAHTLSRQQHLHRASWLLLGEGGQGSVPFLAGNVTQCEGGRLCSPS